MHTQSKFRLLVVRLGAMGDILHALPAVTALRLAHPSWVIDWVVEPRWRALLMAEDSLGRVTSQPLVNTIHFAATKQWRNAALNVQTLHEIRALRRNLRAGEYDAVLDLQGAIRSSLVCRLAGCRRVIGEAKPRERIARLFFTEQVQTHGAHVIEQDLELAAAIAGDELLPVPPLLPADAAADAWADAAVLEADARPAVLINPGAGWGAKRWPADRYHLVARGLIDRGFHVLVNAGPGEDRLAEAVAEGTGGKAVAINCTLGQLISVTRRVALMIAGDTGPLHLACALGRPVVGIYGPTEPGRNGPFGTRFRVLRSPESKRDHTRHKAPEAGLLTIGPEDVLQAADELLAVEGR